MNGRNLNAKVSHQQLIAGAGITQFVGFTGFDADATACRKVVFNTVNRDGSMTGLDKEHFQHIGVGMGRGNFTGREGRLREIGQRGQFAVADQRLLANAGVVADRSDGGLGEGGKFHTLTCRYKNWKIFHLANHPG